MGKSDVEIVPTAIPLALDDGRFTERTELENSKTIRQRAAPKGGRFFYA